MGLVSYLLIGFWFQREAANNGSLKAFIVNRVGDVGFILGIAVVLMIFGTLNYHEVFRLAPEMLNKVVEIFPGYDLPAVTVISLLLFIGAMAKSAQCRCMCGCQNPWKAPRNFCADSRRYHGDRRYLHGCAHVAHIRIFSICTQYHFNSGCYHGIFDGVSRSCTK